MTDSTSSSGLVRVLRPAMNTTFQILLGGAEPVRLCAAGEGALDEIERVETRLSYFRAESDVRMVNVLGAQLPVKIDPRTFALLSTARGVWQATSGAFDVTIAPLLRAWGFTGGAGHAPEEQAVADALALTGMRHVVLDADACTAFLDAPGVEIDLGAIGKGFAVDEAAACLRECGVPLALIDGGTSSVYATGAPVGQSGWRVAIAAPPGYPGSLPVAVLKDSSLSVSAPHGKCFQMDGRSLGHVLDPRSGRPVEGALLAAVVGPSAALGDALSTALLVLGPEGLHAISARWPEYSLLVVPAEPGADALSGGAPWPGSNSA